VDLGGIAKGLAVDLAAEEMVKAGAESGFVDIGGDMRLIGRREDGAPWKIQVRDPRPGTHPKIYLRLADVAVTTSGDYARYFRVGNRKFSHIIDPRTGRPVSNVPSSTVVAPTAATADALSTAISVMELGKALDLINSLENIECMIMVRRGEADSDGLEYAVHYSDGFRDLIAAH
jgi:thiamine biosynthesis lipoprotein